MRIENTVKRVEVVESYNMVELTPELMRALISVVNTVSNPEAINLMGDRSPLYVKEGLGLDLSEFNALCDFRRKATLYMDK